MPTSHLIQQEHFNDAPRQQGQSPQQFPSSPQVMPQPMRQIGNQQGCAPPPYTLTMPPPQMQQQQFAPPPMFGSSPSAPPFQSVSGQNPMAPRPQFYPIGAIPPVSGGPQQTFTLQQMAFPSAVSPGGMPINSNMPPMQMGSPMMGGPAMMGPPQLMGSPQMMGNLQMMGSPQMMGGPAMMGHPGGGPPMMGNPGGGPLMMANPQSMGAGPLMMGVMDGGMGGSNDGNLHFTPGSLNLSAGQEILTQNGQFRFIMQADDNLVLYHRHKPLWASQTMSKGRGRCRCIFTPSGNLIVVDDANHVIWDSGTADRGVSRLSFQNDGNLVILAMSNQPIWATNTTGGRRGN